MTYLSKLRGESEPQKSVVMDDSELRIHLMGHTYKELDGRTWTTTVRFADGTIRLGRGLTHEQAIDDGVVKFREYEAFLALSPEDQLREIMKKDRILDTDKERCIRLLTGIVLDLVKPQGSIVVEENNNELQTTEPTGRRDG